MSDKDWGLILKVALDESSGKDINKQIENLQKHFEPLGIKIDIDTSSKKQIEELSKEIESLKKKLESIGKTKTGAFTPLQKDLNKFKEELKAGEKSVDEFIQAIEKRLITKKGVFKGAFSQLDSSELQEYLKLIDAYNGKSSVTPIGSLAKSTDYSNITRDGKEIIKNVSVYKDELRNVQVITSYVNKETGLLLATTEQLTSNYEEQRKEAEKAQKELENARSKQNTESNMQYWKDEEKARKKRTSDLKEQMELQQKEYALQQKIDNFKKDMSNKVAVLETTKNVDTSTLKQLKNDIKEVTIETDNAQNVMRELHNRVKQLAQDSSNKFKGVSKSLTPYEANIRSVNQQFELGLVSLEDYANKLKEVMYNKSGDFSGQFKKLDASSQQQFFKWYKSAQEKIKQNEKEHNTLIRQKENFYSQIEKKVISLNGVQERIKGKDNTYDTSGITKLKSEYEKLAEAVKNGNISLEDAKVAFNKLDVEAKQFQQTATRLEKTSDTFANTMKRLGTLFGFYEIFTLTKQAISEMVDSIFTLDHALVELQKTSSLTGAGLEGFISQAYDIGEKLGRTGSEVINASSEFSKAGYGDEEIANLAEVALLMTNVGDGINDVAEASGSLIAGLKGFKIESSNAISIVDKINAVSNSTASNFEDITFAIERMSGTLGTAGFTLDETISMFTAVNEVLRNSEIVSSGLTIISSL